MKNIDLILQPDYLIVSAKAKIIHQNYGLAIHDGKIIDILSHDLLDQKYNSQNKIRLKNKVLLSGLINAHTHAAMSLFRGLADDLPLMDWLQNHIWPAEGKFVAPEFVEDGVALAALEMIKSGTTCFADMYFFPESAAKIVEKSGLRAMIGGPIIDFPSAWAANSDEYLAKSEDFAQKYANHSHIRVMLAPHAPYTVSDSPLQKIQEISQKQNLCVQMHVHETQFEVQEAEKNTQIRPLARLKNLNLLKPNFMAVHMTALNSDEIAECAAQKIHVIHCPESNLKLASGFCPIGVLHRAGVNVALGTDGAASNNDLDMWGEMRTAALLAKAVAGDATAICAHEALQMATENGANALNWADEIGNLTIGNAADCISLDISGVHYQPMYDVFSQLVYNGQAADVQDMWVGGRALMRNRAVLTLDEAAILAKAQVWRGKIQG